MITSDDHVPMMVSQLPTIYENRDKKRRISNVTTIVYNVSILHNDQSNET